MKTILVDAVYTAIIENESGDFVKFDEMFELLDKYENHKIIVTNADDDGIIQYGLDKVPYPVFTLKHNPNKLNPVYFETLLTEYGLEPEDAIYFEHNPEAIESAESVGITCYLYDNEAKDLDALKNFLDENL
jgi:HAD superfamily hydrolase (TIGR01509 family)